MPKRQINFPLPVLTNNNFSVAHFCLLPQEVITVQPTTTFTQIWNEYDLHNGMDQMEYLWICVVLCCVMSG